MLRNNRLIVAAVALVVLVAALPVTVVRADNEDNNVLWQMDCGVDHFGPDDPIVHPGQPGASHMHSFYGNTRTNANSTTASMLAAPSSCGRNMQDTDHSGYWVPSLYVKGAGGTMSLVTDDSQGMFIYYFRAGGVNGPKVQPFPAGLKMVAGNATATAPQSADVVVWDCGGGGPQFASPPDCSHSNSGHEIHATLTFPNCWDGTHLDSADHKSHMAYSNATTGACPADHPVSLPQLDFEVDYPHLPNGPTYVLSSGSPYSMHGDFFAAWDSQVQNALVYGCLDKGLNCIDVNRNGNTLTAGDDHPVTPINIANYSAAGQQVLADQTTPAPKPSAVPSPAATATPAATASGSALPDTGPAGLLGGALGLGVLAFAIYQMRLRRLSLISALKRKN